MPMIFPHLLRIQPIFSQVSLFNEIQSSTHVKCSKSDAYTSEHIVFIQKRRVLNMPTGTLRPYCAVCYTYSLGPTYTRHSANHSLTNCRGETHYDPSKSF